MGSVNVRHRPFAVGIVRTVDAREVIAEMSRVFVARDWAAMRTLYHPDALVYTVTGGPDPLAADEVIAELERASEDFVYSVSAASTEPLDEHAAIVTGRMRRRLPRGGLEDAAHVWLLTVNDGLIYRQVVYRDRDEAVSAYARLGLALGLGDPS
jgi:hypothetical protein